MPLKAVFPILVLSLAFSLPVNAAEPGPWSQLDPNQFDPAKDPDIDLFIGHWKNSMPRIVHHSLMVRDILTRCSGDPMHPVRKGAVLTEAIAVSRATLAPGYIATPDPVKDEQQVFYVDSGTGTIASGGKTYDLRCGNAFLVTPGTDFTLTCTGTEPLAFYMITEPLPAGFVPKTELKVKDTFAGTMSISVHWAHIDRPIIGTADGMSTYGGLTEVTIDPMTYAQPHSHNPATEEVWIAVDGDIRLQMGKQFRNLPVGSAYRIPPNGMTVHANVNTTGKPVRLIHMMKAGQGEPLPFSMLNPTQFDPEKDACIDLFMGNWRDSMPRSLFGSLVVRDILTRGEGDPLHPTRKGAVLTDFLNVSYATLYPHAVTVPSSLKSEQQVFYIISGKGTIRAGKQTSELRKGIGVFMPAGLEFTMTNTGGEPLTLYLVAEPLASGFVPKKEMAVRDKYRQPAGMSVHWSNIDRGLFSKEDGLSTMLGIGPITLDAMTVAQPHSHEKGVEEVWLALDGEIMTLLGKQIRPLPVGSAYKVPADGITAHANINRTDLPVEIMWMMKVPGK